MKNILTIILILTAFMTYSQESRYNYSNFGCSESFLIKSDRFIYKNSCGLMDGEISGTVNYVNDTLILNSDIQPSYTLTETFDSTSKNDLITITVKNGDYPNHYGLRVLNGDDYYELDLQDASLLSVKNNDIDNSTTYSFTSKLLSKKERLCFIPYRTNLGIEIDWRNREINRFVLEFYDLADLSDYHFFSNKKAIINQGNLILLDNESKPETAHYMLQTKRKIKVSKKKKVKKYKKVSN